MKTTYNTLHKIKNEYNALNDKYLIYNQLSKKKMISPKKDNDFVKELLRRKESEVLDFKHSITDSRKIAKTIAAFANSKGGILAIGIDDKGNITGIDEEEERFMLDQAAAKWCTPPVEVAYELYEIDYWEEQKLDEESYILIAKIEPSGTNHSVPNANGHPVFYTRVKDRTIPLDS
jgi:predicted HTH transcriptional regulator